MTEELTQAPRYQILVVEDEAPNLHMITATLGAEFHVGVAKTLAKARQLFEKQTFDIVLLDINLPDGSGYDLCAELVSRFDGQLRIIFMTGLTSADDEVRGLNLGAADYIHKPINGPVLQARVRLQAQLLRQNELLAKLARVDGLTEIANRRAFDQHLKTEWFRTKRDGVSLTLVILDIDHFKLYNDFYGHPAGDRCLRDFAQFLVSWFRRSSDFVARYGGEEFAVIMPDTELEQALILLDNAQKALAKKAIPHEMSKVRDTLSFSAGVAYANPKTDDPQKLIHTADQQLYNAKQKGRVQACGTRISEA